MSAKSTTHAVSRGLATVFIVVGGAMAAFAALAAMYLGVMWLRLPAVSGMGANGDPGQTSFMRSDSCSVAQTKRIYVPLQRIDPRLVCAVMWAEDWRFFRHDGFDATAMKGALRMNWKAKRWRFGASTIAMQLARNLYLTRSRTFSRKLKEIVLARRLVRHYDRLRLLEVYLNAAEWAPCVYGIEAGARHYLGHSAQVLDPGEATFLAAMLPRPGIRPGQSAQDRAKLSKRQRQLLHLMGRGHLLSREELRIGHAEISTAWATKWVNHEAKVARPGAQSLLGRYCGSPPQRVPHGPQEL